VFSFAPIVGLHAEETDRLTGRINGVSDTALASASVAAVDGSVKLNIEDDVDCWDRRSNDSDDDDDEDYDKLPKTPSMPDLDTIDVDRFHHRQKKGFIDVWWLFDDGGKIGNVLYVVLVDDGGKIGDVVYVDVSMCSHLYDIE